MEQFATMADVEATHLHELVQRIVCIYRIERQAQVLTAAERLAHGFAGRWYLVGAKRSRDRARCSGYIWIPKLSW